MQCLRSYNWFYNNPGIHYLLKLFRYPHFDIPDCQHNFILICTFIPRWYNLIKYTNMHILEPHRWYSGFNLYFFPILIQYWIHRFFFATYMFGGVTFSNKPDIEPEPRNEWSKQDNFLYVSIIINVFIYFF